MQHIILTVIKQLLSGGMHAGRRICALSRQRSPMKYQQNVTPNVSHCYCNRRLHGITCEQPTQRPVKNEPVTAAAETLGVFHKTSSCQRTHQRVDQSPTTEPRAGPAASISSPSTSPAHLRNHLRQMQTTSVQHLILYQQFIRQDNYYCWHTSTIFYVIYSSLLSPFNSDLSLPSPTVRRRVLYEFLHPIDWTAAENHVHTDKKQKNVKREKHSDTNNKTRKQDCRHVT